MPGAFFTVEVKGLAEVGAEVVLGAPDAVMTVSVEDSRMVLESCFWDTASPPRPIICPAVCRYMGREIGNLVVKIYYIIE